MKRFECGHLSESSPHPDECPVCRPSTEMDDDDAEDVLTEVRETDAVLCLGDTEEGIHWEGRPVGTKWRFVGNHDIDTDSDELPEGSAQTEIDDRVIREALNVYSEVEVIPRSEAEPGLEDFLEED